MNRTKIEGGILKYLSTHLNEIKEASPVLKNDKPKTGKEEVSSKEAKQ